MFYTYMKMLALRLYSSLSRCLATVYVLEEAPDLPLSSLNCMKSFFLISGRVWTRSLQALRQVRYKSSTVTVNMYKYVEPKSHWYEATYLSLFQRQFGGLIGPCLIIVTSYSYFIRKSNKIEERKHIPDIENAVSLSLPRKWCSHNN